MTKTKKFLASVLATGAVALAAGLGSAGPVSAAITGPTPLDAATCPNDDESEFYSGKIDIDEEIKIKTLDITAPNGYLISGYCVKAGSNQQGDGPELYVVDPPEKTIAIFHSSGKDISHYSATYVLDPEDQYEVGQWCSPGFWRQSHHLDSWPSSISPEEKYSAYFPAVTLSKKAKADGASTDPTLWQVLQSPQWYGGEAFNNVGDLLSDAHPDVNYLGERVEDSCPLGEKDDEPSGPSS